MTSVASDSLGHTVRVADVITETPDASSFVIDVPQELADRFAYRPGQFLTVRIPSDRTVRWRAATPSPAPPPPTTSSK